MVWLLSNTHVDSTEPCAFIGVGSGSVAVGRNPTTCQVILAHASISRTHARLSVGPAPECQLFITDLSSTGTWVDGQKLARKAPPVPLAAHSVVIFGKSTARFVVSHRKLVFCTTGSLGEQGETDLRLVATQLGATVVKKWSNAVTHLVTGSSVTGATTKLLCAIAMGVPVVRLEWCMRFVKAVTSSSKSASDKLPDEADYMPSTEVFASKIHTLTQQEPSLSQQVRHEDNDGEINISGGRQSLFAGREFVSNETSNLVAVFRLAGGAVVNVNDVIAEGKRNDADDDDDDDVGASGGDCRRVFVFTKLASVPSSIIALAQRGRIALVSQMAFIHALATNNASLAITPPPLPPRAAQAQAPRRSSGSTTTATAAATVAPAVVSSPRGRSVAIVKPEVVDSALPVAASLPPRGQKRTALGVVSGDTDSARGSSSNNSNKKSKIGNNNLSANDTTTHTSGRDSRMNNESDVVQDDPSVHVDASETIHAMPPPAPVMPPPAQADVDRSSNRSRARGSSSSPADASSSVPSQVIKRPKLEQSTESATGGEQHPRTQHKQPNGQPTEPNSVAPSNGQRAPGVAVKAKADPGGWVTATYVASLEPSEPDKAAALALRERVKDEKPAKLKVGLQEDEEDELKQDADMKAGHLASLFALVELKPSLVAAPTIRPPQNTTGGAGVDDGRPNFRRFRKNFVVGVTSPDANNETETVTRAASEVAARPARARVVACDEGRAYIAGQTLDGGRTSRQRSKKGKAKKSARGGGKKKRAGCDESSSDEDLDLEDLSDMYSDSDASAGDAASGLSDADSRNGRDMTMEDGERAALQAFGGGGGGGGKHAFSDDDDDDVSEDDNYANGNNARGIGARGRSRAGTNGPTASARRPTDVAASSTVSRRRRFGGARSTRARG